LDGGHAAARRLRILGSRILQPCGVRGKRGKRGQTP
jgi:hypothetical protein